MIHILGQVCGKYVASMWHVCGANLKHVAHIAEYVVRVCGYSLYEPHRASMTQSRIIRRIIRLIVL